MDNDNKTKSVELHLSENRVLLQDIFLTYADLLHFAASLLIDREGDDKEIQGLKLLLERQESLISEAQSLISEQQSLISETKQFTEKQEHLIDILNLLNRKSKTLRNLTKKLTKAKAAHQRKKQAKNAANVLHSRPGGRTLSRRRSSPAPRSA